MSLNYIEIMLRYILFNYILLSFLYTGHTSVFAECPDDFPRALDIFETYFEVCGLNINVVKDQLKVMIFSSNKCRFFLFFFIFFS